MARWETFEQEAPQIAAAGRALIYQYGIGLGYLATVRKDGGPRLHPFCPIQAAGGLYGLIIPSPKRADLVRDGRYAIHACGPQDVDDEFYVTGRAQRIDDASVRAEVMASYTATGGKSSDSEWLFEFDIERCLLATYKSRTEPDAWPPLYRKWPAS